MSVTERELLDIINELALLNPAPSPGVDWNGEIDDSRVIVEMPIELWEKIFLTTDWRLP